MPERPTAPKSAPQRKGGLGRGLAALIPTAPAQADGPAPHTVGSGVATRPVPVAPGPTIPAPSQPRASERTTDPAAPVPVAGAVYREIDLSAIQPNAKQPRTQFDEEALAELEHSIREFGLLQPIVVREVAPSSYELVMGERRWRAAQRAGLTRLPAIVRRTGDDSMLRDALLENIHRVQLNPLDEAAAYEQLLAEFGVTQTELADRLGRSRPVVTNTIRLLKLPVSVQRRVAAGVLSAGHARALLGIEDAGRQEELAARIVAEGMSVRATEEAVVLLRREAPSSAKPARRRPMQAPGLQDLAERLSDAFDTRVKVELGQRKGRIVVEFGSVEDLERIAKLMDRSES
ncbi:ParB family chromosome partitioning protein [Pseudonocardia hierapolitana]|uniref:ParB family chromosome partitioning protein n=1 Tax=Pseudonocardia hierapolitana TaxID=1128676 RepID=A0A561SRP2_9PSEU|nr:ParB/RepB/Spo0J family partition protein [Pseudonocardia hierapolitana]TWF77512.1 ParB family chromosome partitioning protein [Pseudonocardia hierapolitana]